MGDAKARWLIYQCNVCKMKIARKLYDQSGKDVTTGDTLTEVLISDNNIPMITFGIGKCSCVGKSIRPSYILAAHCRDEDLPLEIYRDTIKVRLNIPEHLRD